MDPLYRVRISFLLTLFVPCFQNVQKFFCGKVGGRGRVRVCCVCAWGEGLRGLLRASITYPKIHCPQKAKKKGKGGKSYWWGCVGREGGTCPLEPGPVGWIGEFSRVRLHNCSIRLCRG